VSNTKESAGLLCVVRTNKLCSSLDLSDDNSRKIIVYLDSLHNNPNENILNGICYFMQKHLEINSWNEWISHKMFPHK